MRKKTSTSVQLVLITSLLASCAQKPQQDTNQQRVYMRADSTAPYTEVTQDYQQHRTGGAGIGSALLWYMAFRHMGGGMGYNNNRLHPNSVAGTNVRKGNAVKTARSGFGQTGSSRSSATS